MRSMREPAPWSFTIKDTAGVRAGPLTYQAGGKQYLAVTSGSRVLAFGFP
jgi:hypothetical protein